MVIRDVKGLTCWAVWFSFVCGAKYRRVIVRLRENDLVTKAESIRDLGQAVLAEYPDAPSNGVSTARVEALTGAIAAFKAAMILPRGKIVNRSTLLKEVDTDTAALMEQIDDLDDLALQFDSTPEGKHFIEAWKKARVIIDRVPAGACGLHHLVGGAGARIHELFSEPNGRVVDERGGLETGGAPVAPAGSQLFSLGHWRVYLSGRRF